MKKPTHKGGMSLPEQQLPFASRGSMTPVAENTKRFLSLVVRFLLRYVCNGVSFDRHRKYPSGSNDSRTRC